MDVSEKIPEYPLLYLKEKPETEKNEKQIAFRIEVSYDWIV